MRIRRTEPDGTVCNYIYNGSQLSQMTVGGHTLYFTYDAWGNICDLYTADSDPIATTLSTY